MTPAVDPRTEDVVTVPSWAHLFTARAVDDSTNRGAVYVNCSKGKAAHTGEGTQKEHSDFFLVQLLIAGEQTSSRSRRRTNLVEE
jgi:hypothetical protein